MTILLTGVSTGIGQTTAQLLLERGYRVYGSVRKPEDAAALSSHPAFHTLVMDVVDRDSVRRAMAVIAASGEQLTAVINNAGIAVSGPLETMPEADYRQQIEVNVFGTLAVCQEALPLLHAARAAGESNVKIINISSVSGYVAAPFTSMYSASKFAVEAITDGLRRELTPFGIDAISIAPGPVKTPIWAKGRTYTHAYEGTRYAYILEKLGPYTRANEEGGIEPEKVAELILETLRDPRPRPDRLIMHKAWIIRILRQLPKRVQDKLFLRNLEVNRRY
ncbi:SDR family oxidoreductase [Neolewinella lacunae]|uniref:SDR family oxidoreductase n=1 Tax=Neolewinella lacunae TaxID=1517758 RepID=A0A923PKM0_9BACT|nr:SDR family oxidoreductase [Neolewinella lacunae]MBC6995873.1 SDR family oxidoreductase [Neolewinella lacunae]MDN3636434.1 SDR family oxidoreductase [Neolewinella lacunae]